MKVVAINHRRAGALAERILAATHVSPATQLEIAAHWLEEAAASIRHDAALRLNLGRVAHECKAVAYREGK